MSLQCKRRKMHDSILKGPQSRFLFLKLFILLTLESHRVYQPSPPEHVASTSGQSYDFTPETSFSITVGREQSDTRELKNPQDSWHMMENKQTNKNTLPVFVCRVEKYSLTSLLLYRCCRKATVGRKRFVLPTRLIHDLLAWLWNEAFLQ